MRYLFCLLLFFVMMSCDKEVKQNEYHVRFTFDATSDHDFVYDADLIERRLKFQGVTIQSVKKIGERTLSLSLLTDLDTSLLRMIVETRGEFTMNRVFSNHEAKPFVDKLYARAVNLNLVPKLSDELLENESVDLNNFLERKEIDASSEIFDPVIAKVSPENFPLIEAIFNNEKFREAIPEGVMLNFGKEPFYKHYELIAVKSCDSNVRCVTNEWIKTAFEMEMQEEDRAYGLNMNFKEEYKRPLFIFTRNNTGREIAMTLDHKVINYATLVQPIEKGSLQASNSFDWNTNQNLITCLNTGVLKGHVKMSYKDADKKQKVKIK